MSKETAAALLRLASSTDPIIVELYKHANDIDDDALRAEYDKSIGELMGQIAKRLIFPVEDLFPDLRQS